MSGFGLQTPRGTGTSGYLQKSTTKKRLVGFREKRDRDAFEQERKEKRARMSQARFEASEILRSFERKREIAVKCMELRESLEEQDVLELEIDKRVKLLRQSLYEKIESAKLQLCQNLQKRDDKFLGDTKSEVKDGDGVIPHASNRSCEQPEFQKDQVEVDSIWKKSTSTLPTSLLQVCTSSSEGADSKPEAKLSATTYVPRYLHH